ncbi:NUDIX domain-containing protein [Bradyrhizobium sp. B097]|uniref:NUDIX hydrolase n=1 Tax=Bradyrhizobium sp. B097 TaxID=3140244 RepID=UPI0031845F5A
MARTPVLAAGGIVLRRDAPQCFAVVRLRKRNEWVLPKGKLDDGETPRAAAEREVLEETGHDVEVHEFLGTLVYDSGGRSKVVHYWRMDAGGKPVRALMSDVREVDWLPLDEALDRLSRGYERAFLENVGPIALQAAANAERERRARARAAAAERRRVQLAEDEPVAGAPVVIDTPANPEAPAGAEIPAVAEASVGTEVTVDAEMPVVVDAPAPAEVPVMAEMSDIAGAPAADASEKSPSSARQIAPVATAVQPIPRKNLIERVRDWLRRAA